MGWRRVVGWHAVQPVVVVLAMVAIAACRGGGGAPAPSVVDQWVPPTGVELDSDAIYRANRHVFDYDPSAPLDIEQLGTHSSDGVTTHELTYASPAGGRVPATLLVPDGTGLRPGIVLMHGLPSNRTEVLPWAERYTERGAVVILIDAPHARPGRAGDNALLLTTQDRDEQIQLIQDLRRAVDLLISTPGVDSNRMGYVGLSYGAAMGG